MPKARKALSLLLVLLLCLSTLPLTAFASEVDSGPYVYQYTNWYLRSPHRYKETGDNSTRYMAATYELSYGGMTHTAYCCDLSTSAVKGSLYRRVNLEDADYYQNLGDNAAGHIRAIVLNGYWPDGSNGQTLADLEAAVSAWAGYAAPDLPPVEPPIEVPVDPAEDDTTSEVPVDPAEDDTTSEVPVDPVEDDTTYEAPVEDAEDDTTSGDSADPVEDDTSGENPVDNVEDDTTSEAPAEDVADDTTGEDTADPVEDDTAGEVPTEPVEDGTAIEIEPDASDLEFISRSIVSYAAAPMPEITGVSNLTPGEALLGTQLAVWYYGNKGTAYVDIPYTGTLDITEGGTHQSIIGTEENVHGDGEPWSLVNSSGRPQGTAQYSAQSEYNILAVRDYLLSLPPMELEEDNIIFSENYFVDWTYAAADSADSPDEYVVTLKFALQGNPQASDGLTLTASRGGTQLYSGSLFGDNDTLTHEGGVFTLTFATGNLNTGITLKLTGTQNVSRSVYFYEAENGKSQNFVGIAEGDTPVSATTYIPLDGESLHASAVLSKTGENGEPVEGCVFELYAHVSDTVDLLIGTFQTDMDGKLEVTGLNAGVDYYFVERSAPDGYTVDTSRNEIIWTGGTGAASAVNGYATGSMSVTKTVTGLPTSQAFTFNIALDLGTADLENAAEIFAEKGLIVTTDTGEILFRRDGNTTRYTAEISVCPEETVTLTGIPTGTTYTVTELDGDNLLHQGETGGDALYYTPEAAELTGTVNDSGVIFNNTLYIPASTTLTLYKVVQYQGADVALAGRQFTFRLTRWDGNSWNVMEDRQNDPDTGIVSFALSHAAPASENVFYYQIAEVYDPEQATGYLYAPPIFAKVTISNENGILSSTVEYYAAFDEATGSTTGERMEKPTFVNRLTGDTELTLQGVKYLDGVLSATGFSFTLTDVTDPEAPQLVQIVENTGSGLIQFDTIRDFPTGTVYQLTDPDTGAVTGYRYIYEVRESTEGTDKLIVDDTVYIVTVHVAARDGVMKVESVAYTANGEDVDKIAFYNTTVPDKPTTPPSHDPGTEPPPTDDTPSEDVPTEDAPTEDVPPEDDVPDVEIPETDVPLTDTPEETENPEQEEPLVDLEDPDVPLIDNVPQTGDNTGPWLALTIASGTGLAVLSVTGRKRKTEI